MNAAAQKEQVRAEGLRFAGMSLAVNTVMALFKTVVGVLSGSHAVLASALYSVNDVLSSIAVSVSLKLGYRKPDPEYPYGYGKAEFIAVGMVSLAIVITVLAMFFYSVADVLKGVSRAPHFGAVAMAVVSLLVNWRLAHKSQRLADALQSPALATSAEHHHADASGSMVAIVGTVAALLGFHVADRLVAIIETLHLVALSGALLGKSVKGLMDSALPEEDCTLIEQACAGIAGVRRVLSIRSRRVGSETWVDVAVAVPEKLPVVDAHGLRGRVEDAIRNVAGHSVVTQVRFQGPRTQMALPGPAGSSNV